MVAVLSIACSTGNNVKTSKSIDLVIIWWISEPSYFYYINSYISNHDNQKGASNDCSTCQGGSSGTCQPDVAHCIALPWYREDTCNGDNFETAGENGCTNCEYIRDICATSCNWCT